MNSTEALARLRQELDDHVEPYLWEDADLLRYLDQAQTEFCRLTEGLEDGRSPVTRLPAPAGTEFIDLDESILKIRAATDGHGHKLTLMSIEDFGERYLQLHDGEGRTTHLVTGMGRHALRLYPRPHQDIEVRLVVFRLPLVGIDGLNQDFEVEPIHHEALLMHAAALAYIRPDPETMDRTKYAELASQFQQYCTRARMEQGRLRKPNGVSRFSW